jgi:hypothetical protein
MPRAVPFLLAALLVALAGCAPAPNAPIERAQAALQSDPPTFYPHQTGLAWRYLAPGDPLGAPPYQTDIIGPSILEGERVIKSRTFGRGVDQVAYHRHDESGVHLLREERHGVIITYHPPLQEFPAPSDLTPGRSWSGSSTVTIRAPKRAPETQRIDYRFTVLEECLATVPAGSYGALLIEFEAQQGSESLRQTLWFVPHLGAIRTRHDLLLLSAPHAR